MKNAIPALWTAEIIGRIITAFATIYVARVVGIEAYGLVGFASAVAAYLLVFVRFGTDFIIVRDIARVDGFSDREKSQFRLTVVVVRLALSIPAILLLVLLAVAAEDTILRQLYFASIVTVVGTVVPFEFYLQAEERFGAVAGYRVLSNIANLTAVLLFVRSPETSWAVPAAAGTGVLVSQVVFLRSLRGRMAVPDVTSLRRMGRYLLSQGMPLFGSAFLALLVGQFTIILVKAFCPPEQLGCYVAGYRVYDVGNAFLVPTATVLFPRLSGVWSDPEPGRRTALIVNGSAVAVSIALALLTAAALGGGEIIPFLFGRQFAASATIVTVLSLSLVFRGLSMLLANGLVAAGKQRLHLTITAGFAGVSVLLGLILVRSYGALGGAISIVAAFACEMFLFLFALRTEIVLSRIRAKLTQILGLWAALAIPLEALTWYLGQRGMFSLVPAVALTLAFAAAFFLLLDRSGIVTVSQIRKNLVDE